jgi:hypothetical protein
MTMKISILKLNHMTSGIEPATKAYREATQSSKQKNIGFFGKYTLGGKINP